MSREEENNKSRPVICPYCNRPAVLTDSAEVYGGKSYGPIWLCRACDARVGCHKNSPTFRPMGSLANAALRAKRHAAHLALDVWWKIGGYTRGAVYQELALAMGMKKDQCHIGFFDVARCNQVLSICNTWRQKGRIVRPDKPQQE